MARNFMLLYGRNSIRERLQSNPGSIKKIFIQEHLDVPEIKELIKAKNISSECISARELSRMKPARDLQGIVARVEQFQYTPLEELFNKNGDQPVTLIFLDRLNDPQNLGVIIRTAACFGRFAVVIPRHSACEVTEAVLHVASGGENYIPVALVSNLAQAVITAKKRGFWIAGAVLAEEAEEVSDVALPFPLGLVLGSEGGGIRQGLLSHLDIKTRIPMQGAALSFNVAVACAIFCYEICRQRSKV